MTGSRWARWIGPDPGRRRRVLAGLVAALLVSVLCAVVPGSGAAFTAQVTNSTDTVGTRTYFTCAGAVTGGGPALYWALDETSGTTAADSSGNSRTGTYRGTVTRGITQACVRDGGSAITTDGSTGYVSANATLTCPVACSEEVWFRTISTNGGLLIGIGSANTGGSLTLDRPVYLTNSGQVAFGVVNGVLGKVVVVSSGSYNDGNWHHVLATSGSAGLRLYVDGVLVGSSANGPSASVTGYVRISYDSLLGWSTGLLTGYFLGASFDEAAVYTRTLTAAEALSHYQAGIA
ncbi:hypothetical protein FHX74_003214 [Friedmanniella endophytica]|uniref:Concanavalin A-like lectin/glucanases superfamily protein n=1 Tax=Microlunatus kandeliicorticis TaxID=1759536 RepID=A0A7W3IUM9_9ACTN|nr:LamG domain-containing protein [Microlunatus kandeliicorticis]MBA8795578.1 hypothetical protein [Microlunatus kandeliicorticis]